MCDPIELGDEMIIHKSYKLVLSMFSNIAFYSRDDSDRIHFSRFKSKIFEIL